MNSDTRYIFSTGELFQKDFSIVFRKQEGNLYLPIKDTRELYCFNEVTLSTKLLQLLAKVGVVVHFFGYYENYIGTFYPKESLLSGRLTVAQALAYERNRLAIARPIVKGIAANVHYVLYHYYRHGKSGLKEFLDWLRKDAPRLADKVVNIRQLLRIEGEIWARFYQTFLFGGQEMSSKLNYNYAIVFYDVGEKRVAKVFKICKQYLKHYQKSVFRGHITPANYLELKGKLKKVIKHDYDFVAFIRTFSESSFHEESIGNAGLDPEAIFI